MDMQVDTLWLFEATVADPYFIGPKNGITTVMFSEQVIDTLTIRGLKFKLGSLAQAGLEYEIAHGGEDSGITDSYGKITTSYSLHFNMPLESPDIIEKISGRAFSVVGKRGGSYFAIFAPFIAKKIKITNDIVQRVILEAPKTLSRMYKVNNFVNADASDNFYISTPVDNCYIPGDGFDYAFDFALN